ncbi:MAG TPA: hypothetical protein VF474_01245 [Phenylobacterium sp.]
MTDASRPRPPALSRRHFLAAASATPALQGARVQPERAAVSDALAKLQVGIRIVGPEDTDPTAWMLLHEGYEDLADFLGPLADG